MPPKLCAEQLESPLDPSSGIAKVEDIDSGGANGFLLIYLLYPQCLPEHERGLEQRRRELAVREEWIWSGHGMTKVVPRQDKKAAAAAGVAAAGPLAAKTRRPSSPSTDLPPRSQNVC